MTLPTPSTFIYPNGLTLIVEEDPNASNTSIALFTASGMLDEKEPPDSGLSHLLEHVLLEDLLLEKTEDPSSKPPSRLQKFVNYASGWTDFDYTNYQIDVPYKHTDEAIAITFDTILKSELPAQLVARARKMVQDEVLREANKSNNRSHWLALRTRFPSFPYRLHSTTESKDRLDMVTREDLLHYHRQHYSPNNFTIVVVGNVDAHRLRDLFTSLSKNHPVHTPEPVELLFEPSQSEIRFAAEEHHTPISHVTLTWEVPDVTHPDAPALEVFQALLAKSDVLPAKSQPEIYPFGNRRAFALTASSEANERKQIANLMLEAIQKIRSGHAMEKELPGIKSSLLFEKLKDLTNTQNRANQLGLSWLRSRDPNFRNDYLKALQAVSAKDIVSVVNKYFQPAAVSITEVNPMGTSSHEASPQLQDPDFTTPQRVIFPQQFPSPPQASPSDARGVIEMIPAGTSSDPSIRQPQPTIKEVRSFHLPNDLPVWIKVNKSVPLVAVEAAFQVGSSGESLQESEISSLLVSTLLKGTTTQSAQQIADKIKNWGGTLKTRFSNGILTITIETISSFVNPAIDLMADIIKNANFPEQEVEAEKAAQISDLNAQTYLPSRAMDLTRSQLFKSHPYGRPTRGTSEMVAGLDSVDLRTLKAQTLVAKNGALTVSGHIDPHQVRSKVMESFKDLPSGQQPKIGSFPEPSPLSSTISIRQTSSNQKAVVIFGYQIPVLLNSDSPAMELLIEALNTHLLPKVKANQLGRMDHEVEIKSPLGSGMWVVYILTSPDKVEMASAILREEIQNLATNGLTDTQLNGIKPLLINHEFSQNDLPIDNQLRGLGHDYSTRRASKIEAVTPEDIRRVAAKYLGTPGYVETVISPTPTQ